MEIKIKEQKKNLLLSRDEYTLHINAVNNPTKEEVLAFLKKDPAVTVIKEIQGNFGRDVFIVEAFVYDSLEAKERIEYLPQKVRKKIEEEKKKAEEERKKKEEEAKAQENKPVEEVA